MSVSSGRLVVLAVALAGCNGSAGLPGGACGAAGRACCPAATCSPGLLCEQGLCLAADLGMCQPSPEICDGKDNDCNGLVDDGQAAADCRQRLGAGAVCSAGACACPRPCGASCPDLTSDPGSCGACGRSCGPSQSCSSGSCQSRVTRRWVINRLMMPLARDEYSADLDGDGRVDNALANIINVLASQGLDVQSSTDALTRSGASLQLLALTSSDPALASDPAASCELTGASAANPDFSGRGRFVADPNRPHATLAAAIASSALSSDRPLSSHRPVAMTFYLSLSLPGSAAPAPLPLDGVQLQMTDGPFVADGRVQGSVSQAKVQSVLLPAIAAALTARVRANPGDPTSVSLLKLFDVGGCSDQGVPAKAHDGVISPCELAGSDLARNLFAPDVQIYDQSGAYAPNPAKTNRDSLSVGFGFTAVPAEF